MKVLIAACVFAFAFLEAKAQDKPFSPNVTLAQFTEELDGFARFAMIELEEAGMESQTFIRAKQLASVNSSLAAVPMARTATLNILNDLASVADTRVKIQAGVIAVDYAPKPVLSPLSESQWRSEEKNRLIANWKARLTSASKTIASNLDILKRTAAIPAGQKFAMLGSDPLTGLFSQVREEMRETRATRIYIASATTISIEIQQVLDSGCLALMRTGRHWYDYQRIFVADLVGYNIAEGQEFTIKAIRAGVYRYTTIASASSTVEKWQFVTF